MEGTETFRYTVDRNCTTFQPSPLTVKLFYCVNGTVEKNKLIVKTLTLKRELFLHLSVCC